MILELHAMAPLPMRVSSPVRIIPEDGTAWKGVRSTRPHETKPPRIPSPQHTFVARSAGVVVPANTEVTSR